MSYLKECHPENGEEHTFAVETLPRVLEKQFGYKLCIFERDVVPGGGKKGTPDRESMEIIFYEIVDYLFILKMYKWPKSFNAAEARQLASN